MKAFKILATTLLILLCSWSSLEAQQLFRRTQYVFNPYLANPAVAGTKSFTPVMASYRQQWAATKKRFKKISNYFIRETKIF